MSTASVAHMPIDLPFDFENSLLPNGDFADDQPAETRLWCSVNLGGMALHMEAIQVAEIDGMQRAVNPDLEDDLDALSRIANTGPFRTTTIRGKEYVLVLTPYCE